MILLMKTPKSFLIMLAAFCIGTVAGLSLAALGAALFTDMSFVDFWIKLSNVKLTDWLAAALGGIAMFALGLLLQVVVHEVGHLLFGLLSGYRFVSFRIFSFTLIREGGRLRVKRFHLAGTGGQCLLAPPERPLEEVPVMIYNLGGVIANVATALMAVFTLRLIGNHGLLPTLFLVMFAIAGLMLVLLNGIPRRVNGLGNDAYNVRLLRRPQSKRAFLCQLGVNALLQAGVRIKDMPAEWFAEEEVPDYGDGLQLSSHLMKVSRLMDEAEWESAHMALEAVMAHQPPVEGLLRREVECELLFTSLVTGRSDRADALFSEALMRHVRLYQDSMSSKQRLLFAIALCRDKDVEKAQGILGQVIARKDSYLLQGEVTSDIEQMRLLLARTHGDNVCIEE